MTRNVTSTPAQFQSTVQRDVHVQGHDTEREYASPSAYAEHVEWDEHGQNWSEEQWAGDAAWSKEHDAAWSAEQRRLEEIGAQPQNDQEQARPAQLEPEQREHGGEQQWWEHEQQPPSGANDGYRGNGGAGHINSGSYKKTVSWEDEQRQGQQQEGALPSASGRWEESGQHAAAQNDAPYWEQSSTAEATKTETSTTKWRDSPASTERWAEPAQQPPATSEWGATEARKWNDQAHTTWDQRVRDEAATSHHAHSTWTEGTSGGAHTKAANEWNRQEAAAHEWDQQQRYKDEEEDKTDQEWAAQEEERRKTAYGAAGDAYAWETIPEQDEQKETDWVKDQENESGRHHHGEWTNNDHKNHDRSSSYPSTQHTTPYDEGGEKRQSANYDDGNKPLKESTWQEHAAAPADGKWWESQQDARTANGSEETTPSAHHSYQQASSPVSPQPAKRQEKDREGQWNAGAAQHQAGQWDSDRDDKWGNSAARDSVNSPYTREDLGWGKDRVPNPSRENSYSSSGYRTSMNGNNYQLRGGRDTGGGNRFGGRRGERDDDYTFNRDADAFWQHQARNASDALGPRLTDQEIEENERLFLHPTVKPGTNWNVYTKCRVACEDRNGPIVSDEAFEYFEDLYNRFDDVFSQQMKENVRTLGFERLTPVQAHAIPYALAGRDLMVCAQTGSGKTAAYLIPILGNRMRGDVWKPLGSTDTPFKGPAIPVCIVLAPTRELVLQIYQDAAKLSHKAQFRICCVYGGQGNLRTQMKALSRGCDVLIACPGRLTDFMERQILSLQWANVVVLDEADRMLDMGFKCAIDNIMTHLPPWDMRQTMMFSATFPLSIQNLAGRYLYQFVFINIGHLSRFGRSVVLSIDQSVKEVRVSDKPQELVNDVEIFLNQRDRGVNNFEKNHTLLVFANSKATANFLDEFLYSQNIDCCAFHSDLSQPQREERIMAFSDGQCDVMIATDLAQRGLDIPNVRKIINYDMPDNIDDYIHRIGRTGRIGNSGSALSYISVDSNNELERIMSVQMLQRLLEMLEHVNEEVPDWLKSYVQNASERHEYNNYHSGSGGPHCYRDDRND